MPIFEWKTEYETGTQQIDDQHRYLVALINQLDHLINNSGRRSPELMFPSWRNLLRIV